MKRNKIPSGYDTVIGKSSSFKGNLTSQGSIRIDGLITGDVVSEGDVLIGKDGKVKGNIKAVNVHLSGTVEGNITATGILRIMNKTKLFGDFTVKSFVADEGAIFQGKCQMLDYNKEEDRKKEEKQTPKDTLFELDKIETDDSVKKRRTSTLKEEQL